MYKVQNTSRTNRLGKNRPQHEELKFEERERERERVCNCVYVPVSLKSSELYSFNASFKLPLSDSNFIPDPLM